MHSHLCLLFLEPNKLLIPNVNGSCVIFPVRQLYKGMLERLEEMLTKPKWSLELEWRIFFLQHFKSFTSQFGHV